MRNALIPFETRTSSLFDEFRREVDELMSRFFDRPQQEARDVTPWFSPTCNLAESESEYEVTLDLPGLKPEDFNVELRHGELWITGERKLEEEQQGKTWHRVERQYGQFKKMIRLGEDVDPEGIDAQYRDGVLRITVPKTEVSKPRKIAVKG